MQLVLDNLARQLGSAAAVDALPQATLAAALVHVDDVVGLSWERPVFEIPDLDVAAGYTLFDNEYDPLYSVSGLATAAYGTNAKDSAWFLGSKFGDFGYLTYVNVAGTERIILVIRA